MFGFKGILLICVIILIGAFPVFNEIPKLDVKIEKLEPMQVAFVMGKGEEAEKIAWSKLMTWTKSVGIKMDYKMHRIFGHDTRTGYKLGISGVEGIKVEKDIVVKYYPGGIFATVTCKGIKNIPLAWKELEEWQKSSEYKLAMALSLEENLSAPGTPLDEMETKLYLPIIE
jgi:DNA gyrase inhibitor GyrI